MRVTVRYFASVRESVGQGSEQLETTAATLGALREELVARGPAYAQALAPNRSVRMALDQVMQGAGAPLRDGCEVAFFPPVTGG